MIPVFDLKMHVSSILTCRATFEELQYDYIIYWVLLDYSADLVYIADMVFRTRTGEIHFVHFYLLWAANIIISGNNRTIAFSFQSNHSMTNNCIL